jgi:amino acid transporter
VRLYLAFFDNTSSLDWLVILQASMTVVGNFTVCIAAWGIWRNSQQPKLNPIKSTDRSD